VSILRDVSDNRNSRCSITCAIKSFRARRDQPIKRRCSKPWTCICVEIGFQIPTFVTYAAAKQLPEFVSARCADPDMAMPTSVLKKLVLDKEEESVPQLLAHQLGLGIPRCKQHSLARHQGCHSSAVSLTVTSNFSSHIFYIALLTMQCISFHRHECNCPAL
jgi:hypothetical protein